MWNPLPEPYGRSEAETTLVILTADARLLLDSEPAHSNCCFSGESRIQVEKLCFLVSSDIEVIVSWENQAYTDRGFTLIAFSLPWKTLNAFPGK